MKVMMQTGNFRRNFSNELVHQDKEILGLYSDILNHDQVSCDENVLAKWDFYSGMLRRQTTIDQGIKFIKGDPVSNLLLVCTKKKHTIKQVEVSNWQIVRNLKGHKKAVLDCIQLNEQRKVISSSEDQTLKIWDIFTGNEIFCYKLKSAIVSFSINHAQNLLASVWKDCNYISLWKINKLSAYSELPVDFTYHSNIENVSGDKRAHYFSSEKADSANEEFENFDEGFYDELESAFDDIEDNDGDESEDQGQSDNQLIRPLTSTTRHNKLNTFSEIPTNRWINLLHIDIIKQKNRPETKQEMEIPFFLGFDNPLDQIRKENEGEVLEKTQEIKSKIIKTQEVNKYLEELGTPLEKNLVDVDLLDKMNKSNRKKLKLAYNELKECNSSYIDYQLKQCTFGKMENVVKQLMMFSFIMKNPSSFDIKNAIFKNFQDVRISFSISKKILEYLRQDHFNGLHKGVGCENNQQTRDGGREA